MLFTVKFPKFGTPEIFAVNSLKFLHLRVFCQNGANGTRNSEDPDQTAPLGIPISPTPVSPTPVSPTPISPTPVSPTLKC